MKREHPHQDPSSMAASSSSGKAAAAAAAAAAVASSSKAAIWEEEHRDDGMDELLAVLGYKVKSSNLSDVAQKIEMLEEFMGTVQEDGLAQLDNTHYNPANLSNWLDSMITEFNQPPDFEPIMAAPPPHHPAFNRLIGPAVIDDSFLVAPAESSTITSIDFADPSVKSLSPRTQFEDCSSSNNYDLKAIPGKAIFSPSTQYDSCSPPEAKRPRTDYYSTNTNTNISTNTNTSANSNNNSNIISSLQPIPQLSAESTRPVVVVDSQENGVRLVHGLMACAEAVQQNNLSLANALVTQIRYLALSQAGAMRKVAAFFAEALAQRIVSVRVYPQPPIDHTYSEMLQLHFYESCPYLKFAHFTANQAILEAFQDKKRVHVIDFSMNQGMQWPALMQALALRPGGPPTFRLTGIGPPAADNTDHLQEVGWKLAQLAETIHVEFEYRGFVANSLADLDASMLELRPSEEESVAVNSVFELHKLLARPGAVEKVLGVVKQMKPEIVTVVEQEANHNGPVFMDRFNESLHYYSTLFDSLEGSVNSQDKMMSEVYLGKQIFNVVACEGVDRVERHETLDQWRTRIDSSGFEPVHLGSNAFKQASMLLALFAGGDGYRVEENDGCLMLGWHTRPLIATSAWKLGGNSVATH